MIKFASALSFCRRSSFVLVHFSNLPQFWSARYGISALKHVLNPSLVGTITQNRREVFSLITQPERDELNCSRLMCHESCKLSVKEIFALFTFYNILFSSYPQMLTKSRPNRNRMWYRFTANNRCWLFWWNGTYVRYSTRPPSPRWSLAVLGNMLDIAAINTSVVWDATRKNEQKAVRFSTNRRPGKTFSTTNVTSVDTHSPTKISHETAVKCHGRKCNSVHVHYLQETNEWLISVSNSKDN